MKLRALALCSLMAFGCTYDFSVFGEDGVGLTSSSSSSGAGGSSSPSTDSAGGSVSMVGGAGGGAASGGAGADGGTGGMTPTHYLPCGDHRDSFVELNPVFWPSVLNASHDTQTRTVDINPKYDAGSNLTQGFVHLRSSPLPQRCFASIKVVDGSFSTNVFIALIATNGGWIEARTTNVGAGGTVYWRVYLSGTVESGSRAITSYATHLGILVEQATVSFYVSVDSALSFQGFGSTNRPGWFSGSVEPEVGVYAPVPGQSGSTEDAELDDFNEPAVTIGSLLPP